MKTIIIMRHGKSSWKDTELPDIERPLKKRGRKDAAHIGKILDNKKYKPDILLCSTAIRARQTAEIILKEMDFEGEVQYLDSLYMAELDTLLNILQSLPDVARVMVIGHNPGLETLAQLLSDKITSLPTAAAARIKIPINNWQDLGEKTTGELANLWIPKD